MEQLEKDLGDLKEDQHALNAQWDAEKDVITKIQSIKEEIDRVNIEVQQAERNYDLNRAAELKYGKLSDLQKQLQVGNQSGNHSNQWSNPTARRSDRSRYCRNYL